MATKQIIEDISLTMGEVATASLKYRAAVVKHQNAFQAVDSARAELDASVAKLQESLNAAAPVMHQLVDVATRHQTPSPPPNPNAERIAQAELNAKNLREMLTNKRTGE